MAGVTLQFMPYGPNTQNPLSEGQRKPLAPQGDNWPREGAPGQAGKVVLVGFWVSWRNISRPQHRNSEIVVGGVNFCHSPRGDSLVPGHPCTLHA